MARRCWKHSRQKTGRPCVGRKGTVVSLPHCEQLVLVSARTGVELPPTASARLALHALQRFGSFLKPLSAKNICSPAVKTNSAPHSEHFRTLSWYSMEAFPSGPQIGEGTRRLCTKGRGKEETCPGEPGWGFWPAGATLQTSKQTVHYLTGALITERNASGKRRGGPARAGPPGKVNPARVAASCADASAKALPSPGASRRVSCR